MNEDSPGLGRNRGAVVVTGASSGIGRATVDALRSAGFDVLAGVRSPADAAELEAPGVEPLILDITEPDQVEALARRVGELPGASAPRALVNNAGWRSTRRSRRCRWRSGAVSSRSTTSGTSR